jgi:hypothetical protein
VVNGEAVPEQAAQFLTVPSGERFAAVRVPVIQDQMVGPSLGIAGNGFD